jgi:ATP-dependent Clp protease protease subunit
MNTPSQTQWFRIQAQAEDAAAPVEIFVYDAIYDSGCDFFGGVCPADFVAATAPYRDRQVTLRINSPGGSVFAGAAIANYLRSFPKLSAVVDGLAASAASLIFMAAPKERRSMGAAAFLMVHEPSGFAFGPAAVMGKMAEDLRKISNDIAAVYAQDTGQSVEKAKAWMAEETWFNAEEARTSGFVSSVTDAPPAQMNFDLSHFRHPPAALSPTHQPTMNAQNVTACGCQTAGRQTTPTPTTQAEEQAAIRAERDALRAENERLKAGEKSARKARAIAAVDAAIGTGALPEALREVMLARYEDDEEGTVLALGKLRPPGPGVAPIRMMGGSAAGATHSLQDRIAAEPDHRKRMRMRTDNWSRLMSEPVDS